MDGFRIYLKLIAISIQSQIEYRASLALQVLGQFVMFLIEFAAMAGLFARFGSIAGWSFGQAALLYGFADICFAFAEAASGGFDLLDQQIRRGDFDRLLARPLSPFLQTMGQELTLRRAGRLLLGTFVFGWAWMACKPVPTLAGLAALSLGFVGSVAVFVSVITIQGALAFKTVESLEVMNALSYGGRAVSSYPMTVYRGFVRHLFLLAVPVGCSIYAPVCTLLRRAPFPGWPWWIGVMTPFAALPFALLAGLAWKSGVARYESAGG
ncbi:MAG TPA: ABC-2 family transporter protein [Holophaga sp.]|nr:ABC-2 family transporter protein [Holophaga sp.]